MLKIFSTKQICEADRLTIQKESIPSVDLMERAAGAYVDWFTSVYTQDRPVMVIAGVGNNGGDALVMARKLLEKGYDVKSYIVRYSERFSEDLQINLDRLVALGHEVSYILEESQFPTISSNTVLIDGLFGSGLNRKIEGLAELCIGQINASIADVVSIDMPSGLFSDAFTSESSPVILASFTLTFQSPKLAFFLPENEEYLGVWKVLDIGLDSRFLASEESDLIFIDAIDEFKSLFERKKFDHKGSFGHVLLLAGSYGKMGAAVLSANAALRSGVGRLTSYVPHVGYSIMQSSVPEAMCLVDDYDHFLGELPSLAGYSSIGCGPGIGLNKKTKRLIRSLLEKAKVNLVLDADALNIISESKDYLKSLPPNTILTPHLREFERLFGTSKNSYDRIKLLRDMAMKYKVIIVLKGANTAIASADGRVFFNSTGNPGMATAGSGDVLTGIVAGFCSYVKDPLVAAIAAVYMHGLAGDYSAREQGQTAMVASDIISSIGPSIVKALKV